MEMPFGKYKGREVADLPDGYLEWLLDNVDLYGDLRDEVEDEWDCRMNPRLPPPPPPPPPPCGLSPDLERSLILMAEMVEVGYKRLASRHHPDVGGANDRMRDLNQARSDARLFLTLLTEALRAGVISPQKC